MASGKLTTAASLIVRPYCLGIEIHELVSFTLKYSSSLMHINELESACAEKGGTVYLCDI